MRAWLFSEVNGYAAGETPAYRRVTGRLVWRPEGSAADKVDASIEGMVYPSDDSDREEPVEIELWYGISFW